ncbi:MAG: aldose epimerase family protein [Bacteroidota bacterium]
MKRFFLILLIAVAACSQPAGKYTLPYDRDAFRTVTDGRETDLFVLENSNGMKVTLTNYGAKIVSIYVPGRDGTMADVMQGFNSVAEYMEYGASHGATVGPYANRIGGAAFTIDGITYSLEKNNGENTLHSGSSTWSRRIWEAVQQENSVEMTLVAPDGEYGFPGNRKVSVTFTLTGQNELRIDYHATTDKATHINLTNHGYFNLRGEGNGDITGHVVVINADSVTVVDEFMIPTGEIIPVEGTPLDFNAPHRIGDRIDAGHPMLIAAKGYDLNYIINKRKGELGFAASAFEPESGRYMEVFTTEPGVQLYTGNHLRGNEIGHSGQPYSARTGVCFETQHYPDSPNKPHFPSTLLRPGEVYSSTTVFKFSVKE